VRLAEDELAAIELAAGRAGLTPSGYVGAVALAAARGTVPPAPSQTRQALAELMAARAQVRRFGGNVNQAVAALHATGQEPEWLGQAVALTARGAPSRRGGGAADAPASVIGKVAPRGRRVGGLIRYLYATGPAQQEGLTRRNPHTDPRVVAGFDEPDMLEPGVSERGVRDFRRLTSMLEAPLAAAGVGADKKPVYHLIIAAKKDPETGRWWTGTCRTGSGGTSPRPIWTGWGWRRGAMTWRCGGSRCGTPTTMCTSWRRWPGRTGGGCSRVTTSGEPVRLRGRWGPGTG